MMPTSSQFRRLVAQILAPSMKDLGFSRPKGVGFGGWVRPEEGDRWLVVWTQLSRWNQADLPDGSSFTVELQIGDQPTAGSSADRERYYRLLDDPARNEFVAIHNAVMRKVRPRPGRHLLSSDELRTPPQAILDVWLRYTDDEDARRWLEFIAQQMPALVDAFLTQGTGPPG